MQKFYDDDRSYSVFKYSEWAKESEFSCLFWNGASYTKHWWTQK